MLVHTGSRKFIWKFLLLAALMGWCGRDGLRAQVPQPGAIGAGSPNGGAPGGAAGGDLKGTYPNPGVAKISGVAVKSAMTCASDGFVLTWVTANSQFECLGSGIAGSVAFSGITTGTSAVALHVGTGGSLNATGSGTIAATSVTGLSGLTPNTVPKATAAAALGDSLVTDNGTLVSVGGQLSIKANPFIIELPNSSTGTTNNKLAKVVNTAGVLQAQIITTSAADVASAIGCVISGGGTSGTALIMVSGTGSCYFDSATTAGHIAIPSVTSAGALHDTASASTPASGEIMATVGATNACGSPPCLIASNLFMTPDIVSTGGNGNGGGNGGGGGAKQQLHKATFLFSSATLATGDIAVFPGNGAATGTINRVDISGAAAAVGTCSATVGIGKRNAAIPNPVSSYLISASAPATLTTANLAQSVDISTWTKAVAANDVWSANLASVTGCITVLVEIYFQ